MIGMLRQYQIIDKLLSIKVFVLLFCTNIGWAQNLQHRQYTTEDGLLHNIGYTIVQDSNDFLWIGTADGLSRFDGTNFKNYTVTDGLEEAKIKALHIEKNKELQIGLASGKWQKLKNGKFEPLYQTRNRKITDPLKIIKHSKIKEIIQRQNKNWTHVVTNSKGKLYLLSEQAELYIWNTAENKLNNLDQTLTLESTPTAIFLDKEENLWVTTDGGGLYCIYDSPFFNYTANSGLKNTFVYDIFEDKKRRILAGTKNGVFFFTNSQWQKLTLPLDVNYDKIEVWQFRKNREGKTYMATSIGILELDIVPMLCIPDERRTKTFIIDSYNRINLFKNSFFRVYPTCDVRPMTWPVEQRNVAAGFCMFEDRMENLWIGTDEGAFQYKNGQSNHFSIKNGLPHNQINDIQQDSLGRIWFATERGLSKMSKTQEFKNYTQKDGLLSNSCRRINIDKRGGVWVASPQGLHYFDEQNIIPYNGQTGLISDDINCLFTDSEQRLWIGTSRGISMLDNTTLPSSAPAPKVHIESILLNDSLASQHNLKEIPYNSRLTLTYTAISFIESRKLSFRYRLRENGQWQETDNRSISLLDLQEGDYLFQLSAKKLNSPWSEPIVIPFTISPPWWRTWQAFVVYGLLIGAVVLLGVYWIKQRETRKAKRNQQFAALELSALQAQMNPHFIFNALNAIQHFIVNNDATTANSYLNKFARLMRAFLESSKSKYISLSDEIQLLKLYVELEQLCYTDKFDYEFLLDEALEGEDYEIPTMMIQPYIENAIYHGLMHKSKKGHLKIQFQLKGNLIQCSIIDNGVGIKRAATFKKKKHESRGMSITKDRMEVLNYIENSNIRVEIQDLDKTVPETGTKVDIWFSVDV